MCSTNIADGNVIYSSLVSRPDVCLYRLDDSWLRPRRRGGALKSTLLKDPLVGGRKESLAAGTGHDEVQRSRPLEEEGEEEGGSCGFREDERDARAQRAVLPLRRKAASAADDDEKKQNPWFG
jgi:hypothetical protein